jgi:hypothetical protein
MRMTGPQASSRPAPAVSRGLGFNLIRLLPSGARPRLTAGAGVVRKTRKSPMPTGEC